MKWRTLRKCHLLTKRIKPNKTGFTTLIFPVFSRSRDVLWQRNVEMFHKFMCAIVANMQCLPIDWLIAVASWPRLNGQKLLFSFLSFFFSFGFSSACYSQNRSCRYSHLNSKSASPSSTHITLFVSLSAGRLLFSLTVPCCGIHIYHLYNGISPDLRWNERVNESKLSVYLFVMMMHFVVFVSIPLPNGKVEFLFLVVVLFCLIFVYLPTGEENLLGLTE